MKGIAINRIVKLSLFALCVGIAFPAAVSARDRVIIIERGEGVSPANSNRVPRLKEYKWNADGPILDADGDHAFTYTDVLYRGMSAEEFDAIARDGYIESKGEYNIGEAPRA